MTVRSFAARVAVCCAFVSLQAWGGVATTRSGFADVHGLERFVDGAMLTLMEGYKTPSGAVVIVKDDRVLLAKGYGRANLAMRTPVDPAATSFRVGSISKLFTWTAVMQLVEQGKLDLDVDVNRYLKGVRVPEAFGAPVTLHHLLTHSAGFEEAIIGHYGVELEHGEEGDHGALARYLTEHAPRRVRAPGAMVAYSNYGAALAGLIVQEVSGEPFDRYVRRHIFTPLGMSRSTFAEPMPAHLADAAATAYSRRDGVHAPEDFEIIGGLGPAGAASVTPLDMAKFMRAHLNEGAGVLRPDTTRLMHATALRLVDELPGMALGFYERSLNGVRLIAHAGDTEHFHSELLLAPELELGVFTAFVGDGGALAREGFARALFDAYLPAQPAPALRRPKALAPERYEGEYLFTRRNYSGAEKALALVSGAVRVRVAGDRLIVTGLDEEPWQFESFGEDHFRQVDGGRRVAFLGARRRPATHLLIDTMPFMPLERVSGGESPGLWRATLTVIGGVFVAALLAFLRHLRRRSTMSPPERRALYVAIGVASCPLLMACVLAVGFAIHGVDLLLGAPPLLSVALAAPYVFTALVAVLVSASIESWRRRFWSVRRRIEVTAVTLAGLLLVVFFREWNFLSW